ncbi:hypothetical protein SH668x_002619 [Planctomicrobium sp. SH668]|uniref:hypothetical protein n=1 Tax=Planctomicrobium sp. SH668 TaxID=3448126 RepID=UPI003F5B5813
MLNHSILSNATEIASESAPLLADLERKIAGLTGGRIRDLKVEQTEDGFVLSGRTTTYYIKQLASQIVLDESRERPLQNTIEVV